MDPRQEGASSSPPSTQNWARVEAPLISEIANVQASEDAQQNRTLTSEILALEYGRKSAATVDVVTALVEAVMETMA